MASVYIESCDPFSPKSSWTFDYSSRHSLPPSIFYEFEGNKDNGFDTPREAFAALIDKVSGKGTWESNPYVWAYEFELMK